MQLRTLLKHLDLTTLQLLRSIRQDGTLTRAADREAIAVSAASKRLQELEQALGVPLFVRESKGMTCTFAGEMVLYHASEMISSAQRIAAALSEQGARARKTVRIAANLSAIIQFLPEDLHRFIELHPAIHIELSEMPNTGVLQAVRSGAADLGICVRSDVDDDCVHCYPYCRDRLVLVAPRGHALARQGSIAFAATMDADHIGLQSDSWINRRVQRAASAAGYKLKMRAQVSGFDALCRMVHAGLGVGLMPYDVYCSIGQPLGLAAVDLDDSWAVRELQVAVSSSPSMSCATAALLEHLRLAARDTSRETDGAEFGLPVPLPGSDAMLGALA